MALCGCTADYGPYLNRLQNEVDSLQNAIDSISVPEAVEPGESAQNFSVTLDADSYAVDAAGSVQIGFTLSEKASVEVKSKDGWKADVAYSSDNAGVITVSAPDPAGCCDLVAVATGADGKIATRPLPVMVRDPYTAATRPELLLGGYYAFKPSESSLENYQHLYDAGLRLVSVDCGDEDYAAQIEMAAAAGLKVLPILIDCSGRYIDYGDFSLLDRVVNDIKKYPEVVAYHIMDEPSTKLGPALLDIKNRVEQLDPTRPVYINLNPDASAKTLGVSEYYDYVEYYVSQLNMHMISFDMYPVLADGTLMSAWHKCLGIYLSASQRYDIPFWAFAASCWINKEANVAKRAKPSVENLLLQTYTDLAYGAQAVQYFTIRTTSGTDFAPYKVEYDSEKQQWVREWCEAYDYLKECCLQVQKRGYVFDGCKVSKVRTTNFRSAYDTQMAPADLPEQLASFETSGEALVSFVENVGGSYMAVVNGSWLQKQTMSFVASSAVFVIDRDGEFLQPAIGEKATYTLERGEMLVIKYR